MPEKKLTLGQAIDQILTALKDLDQNARGTALSAVCDHLNINIAAGVDANPPPVQKGLQAPEVSVGPSQTGKKLPQASKIDIRALKEEKKPQNAQQMACLVAYYLQEKAPANDRKNSVSAKDLEKYFKQAGFKLPKTMRQILPDGKQSGYFESAGRGEYKLNAVGYNLVAHGLPKVKG